MTQIVSGISNGRRTLYMDFAITSNIHYGQLAQRQGRQFGASWASAIMGPDVLENPHNNVPNIGGAPWDNHYPNNTPLVTFVNDVQNTWKRGHLVNGLWGGTGVDWRNLTPLTGIGNSNHATVEGYVANYLHACHVYENKDRDNYYGLQYVVCCSSNPFAQNPHDNELYSYAPEFIRVSIRALVFTKPNNRNNANWTRDQAQNAVNISFANGVGVQAFPQDFILPNVPTVMRNQHQPVLVLPNHNGNVAGGQVFNPPNNHILPMQNNNFDMDIDIFQN